MTDERVNAPDTRLVVDRSARQTGRTRRMIDWMASAPEDTIRVMVSHSGPAAMNALRQAREMGVDVESWQFIGAQELRTYNPIPMRMGMARYFEFGFDNLDTTLRSMTHWPVTYATIEGAADE